MTQCEHCRELRKTKQVHVKCMCGSREDTGESSAKRGEFSVHHRRCNNGLTNKALLCCVFLGVVKVPASAAFPSGLPEALEASVALHLTSDGSDSEISSAYLFCYCPLATDTHSPQVMPLLRAHATSPEPAIAGLPVPRVQNARLSSRNVEGAQDMQMYMSRNSSHNPLVLSRMHTQETTAQFSRNLRQIDSRPPLALSMIHRLPKTHQAPATSLIMDKCSSAPTGEHTNIPMVRISTKHYDPR